MLVYEVTGLPTVWPGVRHSSAKRSPFKTKWIGTLDLLEREIKHLRGSHVEIACELPRGAADLRNDGQLKADARPGRAVIVSFRTPDGARLQFPCDTYGWWQDNVYAIAKTLENLRAIDRYGATQPRQYEGFKALPSAAGTGMTPKAAAELLAGYSGRPMVGILAAPGHAKEAARVSKAATHPDRCNGDRLAWDKVEEAMRVLSTHHGVSL